MEIKIGDIVRPNGTWLEETGRVAEISTESYPEIALVIQESGYQEWCQTRNMTLVERSV